MFWYSQNLEMTKTNKFGQMIFAEQDLCDLVMQGQDIAKFNGVIVDPPVDLETAALILEDVPGFIEYDKYAEENLTVAEFDHRNQQDWFMPQEYKQLDIAKHVLDLCQNEAELQRVGEELLLYQERNLFDLLRYLKYLVDVMQTNHMIWGVGRGSSVASYVLYLLKVHRVNSMFYDLDPAEFLR
jgi:DNA polymerase III alpha subunit